jgi:predicted nuclease of predicted toxin-antitoxin system
MKILLDECIPRKLRNALPEHECHTVPEAGLAGQKNGRLLSLPERANFDLFFTMDKGIQYQQNLAGRKIAILIVHAQSNRLKDLLPHIEACRLIMQSIQPGEVMRAGVHTN